MPRGFKNIKFCDPDGLQVQDCAVISWEAKGLSKVIFKRGGKRKLHLYIDGQECDSLFIPAQSLSTAIALVCDIAKGFCKVYQIIEQGNAKIIEIRFGPPKQD